MKENSMGISSFFRSVLALIQAMILTFVLMSCAERKAEHTSEVLEGAMALDLDSHLTAAMGRGFSGAVTVAVNDTLILRKGYGWTDSTQTHPIAPETQFFVASMTKGFTGAAVLLAQEQGLLSLSDSLSSFFPGLSSPYSSITIHQLLTHTSGFSSGYETFGYLERDENIQEILKADLTTEPGTDFNYTGAGYWLAAAIVEIAVGVPFERFVYDHIFAPAGMINTDYWLYVDDLNNSQVAQKGQHFPPGDQQPNWGYRGSGGIVASLIDVYGWFDAVVRGDLLAEESKEALFGPHFQLGSGIGVGYGWFRSETARSTRELWTRGGENFGHNAVLRWYEDENVLIIVLTNAGSLDGHDEEANRTISNELEALIFNQ